MALYCDFRSTVGTILKLPICRKNILTTPLCRRPTLTKKKNSFHDKTHEGKAFVSQKYPFITFDYSTPKYFTNRDKNFELPPK